MHVLGIDFGTSNTVGMLRYPDGRVRPLPFDGSPLLPSAVYLTADGTLLVGRDAERQARLDPRRFEPHPKRRIDDGEIFLGDRVLRVAEVIGTVLAHVVHEARRMLGAEPDEVRLTYPARWGERRRAVLLGAARIGGIVDPRLIPEPVAAAAFATAALSVEMPVGGSLAIYDLGGGSFDAAVVRRTHGGFEVLAEDGLPDVGGIDLDRAEFEDLVRPYLDRTVQALRRAITAARVTPESVLLVGGASRIPLAARLIHAELGIAPMAVEQPETLVAEGALSIGEPPFAQQPSYGSHPAQPSGPPVSGPPIMAQPGPVYTQPPPSGYPAYGAYPTPVPTPASGVPTERHLIGELPSRVRIGREFSLIVEIRGAPARRGQRGFPFSLLADRRGTLLWVIVRVEPGMEILGDSEETMRVWPDRDSSPARFGLRALTPGTHTVRVSAWSGGTFVGEVSLQTSAAEDRVDAAPRRASAQIDAGRRGTGEATLLVEVENGRYSFRWLTDGFLSSRTLAEPLAGPPDVAVARTVDTLRRIVQQQSGYSTANAHRWVTETGVGLWQDLVPDPIKDQFWQLRRRTRALYIACSDDWMPWELLYPRARKRDEGFLVQQFPVLRQVPDRHHSARVRLDGAHCVVPPSSPSNAKDEADAVRRTLYAAGVTQVSDHDIDSLDDLLDMLDSGSAGLLHFACHNGYSVEGGGSFIRMAGGNFVPALLNSIRADGTLARRSPLIFLNACRSAGIAPYYTRMMGWAEQFMSAGAGAFIGTLWPVETTKAATFAEVFYAALLAGESLGAAGLKARRTIEDPADPSWLAYTIYGNPNAVATRM